MSPDPFIVALEQRAIAANVTLYAVFKTAGVPHSTLSRWRHGRIPKLTTLRRIESALAQCIDEKAAA